MIVRRNCALKTLAHRRFRAAPMQSLVRDAAVLVGIRPASTQIGRDEALQIRGASGKGAPQSASYQPTYNRASA